MRFRVEMVVNEFFAIVQTLALKWFDYDDRESENDHSFIQGPEKKAFLTPRHSLNAFSELILLVVEIRRIPLTSAVESAA